MSIIQMIGPHHYYAELHSSVLCPSLSLSLFLISSLVLSLSLFFVSSLVLSLSLFLIISLILSGSGRDIYRCAQRERDRERVGETERERERQRAHDYITVYGDDGFR